MNCEYCGTTMKALFTSNYCPNDCDKKIDKDVAIVNNYLKSALKTLQELLAYETPITKILEENTVKEIQEAVDAIFFTIYQLPAINYVNPSAVTKLNIYTIDTEKWEDSK